MRLCEVTRPTKRKQSGMGKIKPKVSSGGAKESAPKVSLKTIVKPKDKLKVSPVVQVKETKVKGDFVRRPALKRKQKAKKQNRVPLEDDDATKKGPPTAPKHQKKHEKVAERKQKLRMKFELMIKEQKQAQKEKKLVRANKKLGSVATMGAIKDALPSLDSLLKFKGSEIKTGIPEYDSIQVAAGGKTGKKKTGVGEKRKEKAANNKFALKEKRISKEAKEQSKRYDYLQKLMNDKGFRADPRKVIAEHIKNTKLEREAE